MLLNLLHLNSLWDRGKNPWKGKARDNPVQ